MERDCESELSKLNIEQNACIYHFGASVIHGQRSNILRLLKKSAILITIPAMSRRFIFCPYSFAKEKQMKCKFVAHVSFVYDNISTGQF